MRRPAPIDLRSIRYLIAIVDEGTFARAAEKLRLTQPALSRSVQALEHSLGVKLLDRGKAGATPTVFGRVLMERGRQLISDSDAIAREIELLSGAETGAISIGAGTYPAEVCVGAAAARLLTQRPALDLRITVGDWPDLTDAVLSEKIDLAICDLAAAEANPRLRTELLPPHRGVLFCRAGHPLATRDALTFEDVREFPLALTALPDRLGSRFRPDEEIGGKAAAPQVHVDTFQLARQIVLESDVIGGALTIQIAEDLRSGRVVALPLDLAWLTTRYGFIYLAGRTLAPSLELFMSHVRAVESEVSAVTATVGPPVQARREPRRKRVR